MQKSKKSQNKHFCAHQLLICAFIFALALLLSLMNPQNVFRKNAVPSHDDAVFQSIAFHMSRGEMPYRDIFDHKGPLLYVINFLGFIINANWGIWLLELIAIFITLLIIYRSSRLFISKLWSAFTVLFVATLFTSYIWNEATGVETFSLPFISFSIYSFLKFLKNKAISTREIIATGACLGAVLMLRPNMVAVWAVFCLAVLIEFVRSKDFKNLFAYILKFAIGMVAVIAPLLIWLLCANSFSAFIDCYIGFNSYYSLHSGESTLSNRISALADPFKNQLILLSCFALLFAFFVDKKKRKISVYSAVIILVTLLSIATSGRSYPHYYTILIPCLATPIILALSLLSISFHRKTLLLVLALFGFYSVLPSWTTQIENAAKLAVHSRTNLNYEQYGAVIDYIKAHSTENDRISAWFNQDSTIYIGSNRLSATRYSYVPEIIGVDENREQEFRKQLESEKPKFIILPKSNSLALDYSRFAKSIGYTEASDFYDEKYLILEQKAAGEITFNTTKIGKVLEDGTLFDPDVYFENDTYYLYVSARGESSIVRYESTDGINWTNKKTVVALSTESEGTIINRATVLKKDNLYYIYYSTQKDGKSYINVATGKDGVNFEKYKGNPIISPEKDFEGESTMNADVLYDNGVFRMWYATGETYEPNTISYAESKDGFKWKKQSAPIKHNNPEIYFTQDRVGGPEVLILDNKYYLFYIGYSDINTGYIMLSSSNNGVSDFKDYEFPLVSSGAAGFDKDSVYKPTVHYDKDSDTLYIWYNGRNQSLETIGLVTIDNFKATLKSLNL